MNQRVFVSGATGYIGSAVAARLLRAGYEVLGLTRSKDRARALEAFGIQAIVGDLSRPESFIANLKNCDAMVHTAFDAGSETAPNDQRALEAAARAVQDGRLRQLIYTSGVWVHGDQQGRLVDEDAALEPLELVKWRAAHEDVALDLVELGVRALILRPAMVYGGAHGTFGGWWQEARERHTVTYPGDGTQHWAMVHRDDVADGYALALEHGNSGERYLLADGSQLTVREMAEAVAAATGATAKSRPREDVIETLGLYGRALLSDLRVSAARARRDLGWVPRHTHFVHEAPALLRDWQAGQQATVR